jgi:hypothetical protein
MLHKNIFQGNGFCSEPLPDTQLFFYRHLLTRCNFSGVLDIDTIVFNKMRSSIRDQCL